MNVTVCMSRDEESVCLIRKVDLAVSCAAFLAHLVGLLAIYLYKKKSNQNFILSSLSASEILNAICQIV